MSTPDNGIHQLAFDTPRQGLELMSETRPLYWSLRRELWENRSIYIAPVLVTGLVFFACLITVLTLPGRMQNLATQDPAKLHAMAVKPFQMAPAPIMLTTFIIGMFYCLDALYGERRERSILFWKSLPVSDLTTILSKVCVPMIVLPLIGYVLSVGTQVLMLIVSLPVLAGSAVSPVALWNHLDFFERLVIMFYGLAVHALWFAPIYGWLLMVSAWARRAPFLWAVLPLLGVAAVERILFNTMYFMNLLRYRLGGAMQEAFEFKRGAAGHVDRFAQLQLENFITTPGLWLGIAFAAVCVATAVWLRRNREAI